MTDNEIPTATNQDISLLLSGGGFRATLFHLGVVRCLRERKLLENVKQIYSVSGGSILAGHIAKNWNDYIGQEDQFDRATSELVDFTRQGVRESIVRLRAMFWCICVLILSILTSTTWLLAGFQSDFPFWIWVATVPVAALIGYLIQPYFKPVYVLENAYRRLFGRVRLADVTSNAPDLFVLGTNLTAGSLTCFTREGIVFDLLEGESSQSVDVQVPLAAAVAASSAFPPLFSPWIFNPRKHNLDRKNFPFSKYISDGGVYDNLGVAAAIKLSPKESLILVSDAERRFDWATNQSFRFVVSRTSRAFDIVMNRLSTISHVNWGKSSRRAVSKRSATFLRLQDDRDYVDDDQYRRWRPIYTHTRQVRTDLDSFSEPEIQCLVSAGYLAASQWIDSKARVPDGTRINANGFPILSDPNKGWLPVKRTGALDVDPETVFSKSTTSQLKFIDFRNWQFWSIIGMLLCIAILNPISISWMRGFPVSVSELMLRAEHVERIETLKPFLTAIEPQAIDLVSERHLPRKQNLLLEIPMSSANWFFLRRQEFVFSVECKLRDSEVEYVRSVIVTQDGSYFSYCQPLPRDSSGNRTFICPKTEEDQLLVIFLVVGTSEQAETLTSGDFTIQVHK